MNTYEERLREKMGCKCEYTAIYIGDAYLMEANEMELHHQTIAVAMYFRNSKVAVFL